MRDNGDDRGDGRGRRVIVRLRRLRAFPMRTVLLPQGEMPRRSVVIRLALALVLALVLWVRVSADTDPTLNNVYRDVTIKPLLASGYSLLTGLPVGVLHVDALQSQLRDAPTPSLYVDLTHVTSTSPRVVPVQVRDAPPGARISSYSPLTVTVQLEKEVTRPGLPVQILPLNEPPPGFTAPSISISPPTVTITGPSREVTRVVTVRLPRFNEGVTQNATLSLAPLLFDSLGHSVSQGVVRITPPSVAVVIHVHLKPFQQLLPVTLDPTTIIGQVAPGYTVTNIAVFPQFVQASSSAQLVTATLTTAPITISGLTATHTFTTTIQFSGPPGVTLRATQAIVTVSVAPISGSAAVATGVVVVNKRPGTTVTLDSSITTVLYSGLLPALRAAAANPPPVVLDAGRRVPGVYYLLPTVSPPSGLKVLTLTPPVLRVTITAPPRSSRR